jgi:hypothetical protein
VIAESFIFARRLYTTCSYISPFPTMFRLATIGVVGLSVALAAPRC